MLTFIIYTIGVLLSFVATTFCMILGIDWLTIGHGLHPVLSFTAALFCAFATAWFIRGLYEEYMDWAFT